MDYLSAAFPLTHTFGLLKEGISSMELSETSPSTSLEESGVKRSASSESPSDCRHFEHRQIPSAPIEALICHGCGHPISDRSYLLVDAQTWHEECLHCRTCQCQLQWDSSCFRHGGGFLCRTDYISLSTCPGCEKRFGESAVVVRLRPNVAYHVGCLRCWRCAQPLRVGESCFFQEAERRIFCLEVDCAPTSHTTDHPMTASRAPLGNRESLQSPLSVSEPRTRITPQSSSSSSSCAADSSSQKRIRTSFKHDQLGLMKAYFKANQNPDSKELKQLSLQTKLPKRVLQVWFQNARAKYRRWHSSGADPTAPAAPNDEIEDDDDDDNQHLHQQQPSIRGVDCDFPPPHSLLMPSITCSREN